MANRNNNGQFIRRNFGSVIMIAIAALLIFSPAAKGWVMRQMLRTGFFNAHIDKANTVAPAVADFSLNLKDGRTVNISALRGKVVFLNFWASWCPPCRAEFPGLVTLYSHFKNNPKVVFLFIDEDDELSTGERFVRQQNYGLPLAMRAGNVPSAIYKGTLPTTVIVDKTGKISFHHEGFAGYDGAEFTNQLEQLIKE